MANRTFPELPPPPFRRPAPIEIVVPRQPLANILQALGITIQQVVNGQPHRGIVRDLFKVSRRIDNESWLRGRLQEIEDEAWTASHL